MKRITYLDGFRGVAILLVLLFHCYTRWPEIVPYGSAYAEFPLFKYGWVGVELFFLISGFVILMTLENCGNFVEFIQKRWLRLFPAMLIATILVLGTAGLFPERPSGKPALSDIWPGLLFIEPDWIGALFGVRQSVIEGAFWSLFVEVKFYVIFGSLFYRLKKRIAEAALSGCFLLGIAAKLLSLYSEWAPAKAIDDFLNVDLSFKYFGWFALGANACSLFREFDRRRVIYAIALGIVVALNMDWLGSIAFSIGAIGLFYAALFSETLRRIASAKVLLLVGSVSYPLYLIHENMTVALIVKFGGWFPSIPMILLPIIPACIVGSIAFAISKYCEPALKRILAKIVSPRRIGHGPAS